MDKLLQTSFFFVPKYCFDFRLPGQGHKMGYGLGYTIAPGTAVPRGT